MARTQVAAVLIGAALLIGAGAGLNFDVTVPATIESQLIAFDHTEDRSLHTLSVSAANTGSVTCGFRMRAEFNRANRTITRYSPEQIIYPGEEQLLELSYLPYNYTGHVSGRVWVEFCDREQRVGNVSFRVGERLTTNRSIESRTVRVTSGSATVRLDVGDAVLLPEQAPGFWRPSAARVRNGTAVVRYDPPAFDRSETLTYHIYDRSAGELVGRTEITLTPELTLLERLERNRLPVALAVSVLLNLVLLVAVLRQRRA